MYICPYTYWHVQSVKLLQISPKSGNALKIRIMFTPTNVDDPSHSYLELLAKNHKLANKIRKHTHASNRRFAWLYVRDSA